jgi:hypothetical protein
MKDINRAQSNLLKLQQLRWVKKGN